MMPHPLLTHGRILFVIDGCEHCMIWKEFIEKVNAELKWNKQIKVIDCTRYHDFGMTDNEIIKLFAPYTNGSYPVMFIDGSRKDGTSTRIEAEAWLRSRVFNDFAISQSPEYYETLKTYSRFNKICKSEKDRLVCDG